MNDTNTLTAEIGRKERLGKRALSFIISKHARLAIVLFVIAALAFFARHSVGANAFMDQVVMWSLVLFPVFLVYGFLVGWIVYANYSFMLETDAFEIRHGVFSKEETAIPYRQIRDVNITRSLAQQMAGVSTLIILTDSSAPSPSKDGVSAGVTPMIENIDKHRATFFQNELLKRANVQKISQS